ncbi:acyl-CoA dehydrogenase family protein [Paraburkholderia sp. GAS82]|uniref:acyl-CoA dehydrogenase family protein n=1 Tax=Paraburkholderia sp. GAS82 TaxID=3035137 RepID=UPI003D1C5779
MTDTAATAAPDATQALIDAADALGPIVAKHKKALALGPDLPLEIAEALEAAGLTRLWLPRNIGGMELSPVDYFRVMEAVSRHDGSVGWCASIASTGTRAAGLIPQSSAAQLLADGGFVAGSLSPTGKIVKEKDGWRINGRWPWGSFIVHSKVTLAVCVEYENGVARSTREGGPVLRAALLPTREVNIIRTWDGGGLRSSGSHDFAIENGFVEDARTFALTDFNPEPCQPGALYGLPFITMFALGITAVSLGIARGSIDALVELAQHKVAAGAQGPLREQASVQAAVAQAETAFRSARGFLFESVQDLWDRRVSGQPDDMKQRALVRMASCNVVDMGKEVAMRMFEAAGGSALHERSPFSAYLRDAQAAAQHLAFSQRNMETAGRVLLGLHPGTHRF